MLTSQTGSFYSTSLTYIETVIEQEGHRTLEGPPKYLKHNFRIGQMQNIFPFATTLGREAATVTSCWMTRPMTFCVLSDVCSLVKIDKFIWIILLCCCGYPLSDVTRQERNHSNFITFFPWLRRSFYKVPWDLMTKKLSSLTVEMQYVQNAESKAFAVPGRWDKASLYLK